jgi:hypothetical protein
MLGSDTPFHVKARAADPYVHLDNRAFILHDGYRGVLYGSATLGWVRETIKLLAEEKRATRRHGESMLGGIVADDGTVTLYGGPADSLTSVQIDVSTLGQLYEALGGR